VVVVESEAGFADGRHERSAASRRRIIQAALELILEGNPNPRAEDVAARAGVGLRTVFRLFRDMESIYADVLVDQRRIFLACFTETFTAPPGASRVLELYGRLAVMYEAGMPMRRTGVVRRYKSPSLAAAIAELDATIAEFIDAEMRGGLPPVQRSLVNLLMSYDAWMRLRDGQGVGYEEALALMMAAVEEQLK
jgi:AcrR family transcriptional regulator